MASCRNVSAPKLRPLQTSTEPRWLKITDRYGTQVQVRELAPGTDLRAELEREAAHWAAQGWEVEGAAGRSFGGFFMNRGDERHVVSITRLREALLPHSSPNHLGAKPGRGPK